MTMDDKLLTADDLAAYLQIHRKTVYRMLRRTRLPCYRVGNQWRFSKQKIDEWLAEEGRAAEQEIRPDAAESG
jgi:excisionase family DNA binding protein